jgi:hypothetical protein
LGLGGTDSLGRMRWWSGWCRKKSDYSRGQAVPKNGERGEGRRVKQRRLRLKEGRKGLWETRFSKRLKGKWTGSWVPWVVRYRKRLRRIGGVG